ncbi:MAG: hypothetical protein O7E49_10975 [Gemmatimonadetes bacterium]|nr:hypothetical protein [Gemmatimonadota bacterium]
MSHLGGNLSVLTRFREYMVSKLANGRYSWAGVADRVAWYARSVAEFLADIAIWIWRELDEMIAEESMAADFLRVVIVLGILLIGFMVLVSAVEWLW